MNDFSFCVSMSTIPSRVKNINDILGNINNQTLKPDKIFLNIPHVYNRFKNEIITEKDLKHINRENIEIIRDNYGVPHVYSKTDKELAYGLAWVHSEDDFKTIQEAEKHMVEYESGGESKVLLQEDA